MSQPIWHPGFFCQMATAGQGIGCFAQADSKRKSTSAKCASIPMLNCMRQRTTIHWQRSATPSKSRSCPRPGREAHPVQNFPIGPLNQTPPTSTCASTSSTACISVMFTGRFASGRPGAPLHLSRSTRLCAKKRRTSSIGVRQADAQLDIREDVQESVGAKCNHVHYTGEKCKTHRKPSLDAS